MTESLTESREKLEALLAKTLDAAAGETSSSFPGNLSRASYIIDMIDRLHTMESEAARDRGKARREGRHATE